MEGLLTVGSVIGPLCQLWWAPSGSDQKTLLALKHGHVGKHLFEGAYHDLLYHFSTVFLHENSGAKRAGGEGGKAPLITYVWVLYEHSPAHRQAPS